MRKHTTTLIAVAAFALGGLASAFALLPVRPANTGATKHGVWREVAWPFPMDQWGKGTALQCDTADCGTPVTIYLRAKVGFCNCTSGMADDAELARVSDFDLFGGALYAQAAGQPVKAGFLKGRSRPYAIRIGNNDATMISVGLHDNCDALVATAVLERGQLAAIEPVLLDFLNGKTMREWAEVALGL